MMIVMRTKVAVEERIDLARYRKGKRMESEGECVDGESYDDYPGTVVRERGQSERFVKCIFCFNL